MSKNAFKTKHNRSIFKEFKSITYALNKIGIKPTIYGSLGLYFLIGEKGKINDIDYILSKKNFSRWDELVQLMKSSGYDIDSGHKQEFIRGNFFVSFIDIAKIEKLIHKKLTLGKINNSLSCRNLALADYLAIYQKGLHNKWRKKKKERSDLRKIKLIQSIST